MDDADVEKVLAENEWLRGMLDRAMRNAQELLRCLQAANQRRDDDAREFWNLLWQCDSELYARMIAARNDHGS